MKKEQPKTVNALMKYLRDEKEMEIRGSNQKRKLMNMGYYHAYKGYRYIQNPAKVVSYSKFAELVAVYQFDSELKRILYSQVMFIETAIKNYVLESIVLLTHSDDFATIYSQVLDNYKHYAPRNNKYSSDKDVERAEQKYKKQIKNRLELRNKIYKVQTNAYSNNNQIAKHYLEGDRALPIWAVFELLSLGEFGYFVSCMNYESRHILSALMGIRKCDDTAAQLPQTIIFTIKDLKNAIAHNDVVFDTRFRTGKIAKRLGHAIENETLINGIRFNSITDYLLLIIYILKHLGESKTVMRRLIKEFDDAVSRLRREVSEEIFSLIIYTDYNGKLERIKKYVSA